MDIAQLALATFANNNGLRSQGNVSWYETADSGEPIIGVAGSEGVGTLTGSSLEASNTDQSGDMVKLLAAQQAYQANAQAIKLENQNYQTLIAMGG
jgi:flagellar hook protein FlgE